MPLKVQYRRRNQKMSHELINKKRGKKSVINSNFYANMNISNKVIRLDESLNILNSFCCYMLNINNTNIILILI